MLICPTVLYPYRYTYHNARYPGYQFLFYIQILNVIIEDLWSVAMKTLVLGALTDKIRPPLEVDNYYKNGMGAWRHYN